MESWQEKNRKKLHGYFIIAFFWLSCSTWLFIISCQQLKEDDFIEIKCHLSRPVNFVNLGKAGRRLQLHTLEFPLYTFESGDPSLTGNEQQVLGAINSEDNMRGNMIFTISKKDYEFIMLNDAVKPSNVFKLAFNDHVNIKSLSSNGTPYLSFNLRDQNTSYRTGRLIASLVFFLIGILFFSLGRKRLRDNRASLRATS